MNKPVQFISTQSIERFWEQELDFFSLPEPMPSRIASRLAQIHTGEPFVDRGRVFEPHAITRHIEYIMVLEKQRQQQDPLAKETFSVVTDLENRAAYAGLYWLAITGVLPGHVGVNDALGTWLFKEAATCAAPNNRKAYTTLARKFPDVRNFIEYVCYHRDHRPQFLTGPRT